MDICKNCFHRVKGFDEFVGEYVKCIALRTYLIPEPYQTNGFYEVQKTGKCEFCNKEIYFDEDGFVKIKQNEGNSLNLGIYD